MHAHIAFFKEDELVLFKQELKKYCEQMNYHDIEFSEDEIIQLSWYKDNSLISPQAQQKDLSASLPFEVKRGLARRYSFELILRGSQSAYEEFIKAQAQGALSFESFKKLSEEAQQLDENTKTVVRASCFLTISDKAKSILKEKEIVLSNDSEEFLSQLANVLLKNNCMSITKKFSAEQLAILPKMFWPNLHLRHLMYTEGGKNMTQSLANGVLNQQFTAQDFLAWKWRWLTNLFGFHIDFGAKYYNADTHLLTSLVIENLEEILHNPAHSFLENYLLKRAELAGLTSNTNLTKEEQLFLGHLAAFYNQFSVLSPKEGLEIYKGYIEFKKSDTQTNIAKLYETHCNNINTITPTYVPAIINNSYLLFKNKFGQDTAQAIEHSSLFMCLVLNNLYSLNNDKRISCMQLAKPATLEIILEKWGENQDYQFELDEKNELQAKEKLSSTLRPAMQHS